MMQVAARARGDRATPELPADNGGFNCYLCGADFTSWGAWRTHQWSAHRIASPLLRGAYDTHCIVCLREFHDLDRLKNHLRSTNCLQIILASPLAPPAPGRIKALQADARKARDQERKHAKRPYVKVAPSIQLAGPLPRWAV